MSIQNEGSYFDTARKIIDFKQSFFEMGRSKYEFVIVGFVQRDSEPTTSDSTS